ncbi:MAG: metallophosphoesterase [Candidatus Omnitrophica bacterium]|nr:metallophosphoesterase [Candidatus Omnitrophota bacterium]
MRTFAIGDIHGAHKALLQCLERSRFDYQKDHLIVLGDVCDGYPEVRQCIDELLKIERCDFIIGNHDQWALDWALRGYKPKIWISQGGDRTIASYDGGPMPKAHFDFLMSGKFWLELDRQVFVHGGFYPSIPLVKQTSHTLMWDRDLLDMARKSHSAGVKEKFGGFEDIFLGHTTTQMYGGVLPLHFCNIWDLDTGGGFSGKLTIMDVKTKEFWQSDPSHELYIGVPGR